MPKITAYKCPFTKKLFETRSGYRRHLLKLRIKQAERRKRHQIQRRQTAIRAAARERMDIKIAALRTAADVEKFIVENFHDILVAVYGAKKLLQISQVKMEWFKFDTIHYSDHQGNTHNCPRSGVTNWGGRKEGAPRGYPGFGGQMKWKLTGPKELRHGSAGTDRIEPKDALSYIGVHTGTGCPGWDGNISYQFFVDDFRGIKEEIHKAREAAKKEIFEAKLKGLRSKEHDIILKHCRPIAVTQKELDTV